MPPGRPPCQGAAVRGLGAALAIVGVLAACAPDRGAAGGPRPVSELAPLDPPAGTGSGQPRLSVDPTGGLILSWVQPAGPEGEEHELLMSALEDGGWSEPRTVARGSGLMVNWADFPSVIATGRDSMAAHWLEETGSSPYAYGVRIAFSHDGGRTWSRPVVPHRDRSPTEHGFVSLVPLASGGVRAVWLDGRRLAGAGGSEAAAEGGPMTLRTAAIRPGGEIRDAELLDDRVCDCCQTDATRVPGGLLVVYRDRSPGEVRDISAARLGENGWSRPSTVHRDGWRIAGCPVNGPALDARGDTAAVAWFTGARDVPRVRAAFTFDGGRSFGPPVDVDDGRPIGRADVALLPGGRALVGWLASTEDGGEIRIREVTAAGEAGPATAVARASTTRATGFPRLVVRGSDVTVAWTDPSGEGRVRAVRGRLSDR